MQRGKANTNGKIFGETSHHSEASQNLCCEQSEDSERNRWPNPGNFMRRSMIFPVDEFFLTIYDLQKCHFLNTQNMEGLSAGRINLLFRINLMAS